MSNDHVLRQYQKGEERGIGLLRALKTFAPDEAAKEAISGRIEDEVRRRAGLAKLNLELSTANILL